MGGCGGVEGVRVVDAPDKHGLTQTSLGFAEGRFV